MERKKVMQAETKMKKFFVLGFALVLGSFVACDDGSSANHNDEELDGSSSSVILSGGSAAVEGSSGSAKSSDSREVKSSSSIKQEGASAESNGSSGAAKSSSSVGNTSSSSSSVDCEITCIEECEGTKRWSSHMSWLICKDGNWYDMDSLNKAGSSSSYYDMSKQFNPMYSYGEFKDPRDGRIYKTIKYRDKIFIGDSVTFFAENLNYGKMIAGGATQSDSTKYCYDDDPWYCENGFGGLYSWSNAMNLPESCDSAATGSTECSFTFDLKHKSQSLNDMPEKIDYVEHQGICPDGWHVMSLYDWRILMNMVDDNNFMYSYFGSKATTSGSNTYGFSLLHSGIWEYSDKKFEYVGELSLLWLPQDDSSRPTMAKIIRMLTGAFSTNYNNHKKSGQPIRCVKDY